MAQASNATTTAREAMARKAVGLAVATYLEAEKTLPVTVDADLVARIGACEVRLTPLQGRPQMVPFRLARSVGRRSPTVPASIRSSATSRADRRVPDGVFPK